MSRKSSSKSDSADSRKVTFQGFLTASLSQEEKRVISANPTSPDAYGQILADATHSGYKVSLSFSPGQDTYILTAYGNRLSHPDAGYAISFHHRDYGRCFDILAFCLEEAGKAGSFTQWLGKDDDLDW